MKKRRSSRSLSKSATSAADKKMKKEIEADSKVLSPGSVCICCGVVEHDISGCSCLGGPGISHTCEFGPKHLTAPRLTQLLHGYIIGDLAAICFEYLGKPFISTWSVGTRNTHLEDSNAMFPMSISLPLSSDADGGEYDFIVDWGDGKSDHITESGQSEVKHVYAQAGNYVIELLGEIHGFTFNESFDSTRLQITDISQWGCVGLAKRRGHQFYKCSNLRMSALDAPDLTGVYSMCSMFELCSSFDGDMSQWNTTCVDDMSSMFRNASSFNGDVSRWSTGNVILMNSMFSNATVFKNDVSHWDTSKVINMREMFSFASSFNGDLSRWNTQYVTDMCGMFLGAKSFRGTSVRQWNTANVLNMEGLFMNASKFKGNVSQWNVDNVFNKHWMFYNASAFNRAHVRNWTLSSEEREDMFK